MPVSTVSIPVGQWFTSQGDVRWWFDSGALALDFAYTGPIGSARVDGERLRTPDDLSGWLGERFPVAVGAARSRDLFDAVALRDAITHLALAATRGQALPTADIDIVNLYAATPDVPPTLAGGSRQAGRSVQTVGQALSTIARDAVDTFAPANLSRLHECSADDCDFIYLDTSRAGTRRWCSMQRCGNRAKVRAHRARKSAVRGATERSGASGASGSTTGTRSSATSATEAPAPAGAPPEAATSAA